MLVFIDIRGRQLAAVNGDVCAAAAILNRTVSIEFMRAVAGDSIPVTANFAAVDSQEGRVCLTVAADINTCTGGAFDCRGS